jgi:hypothetical protein
MKVKIFNAYDLVIFETWIEIQVSGSDIRIKLPNVKESKEILKYGDPLFPEDILNTTDVDLISVMCANWSPVISKFLLGEIQELEEIDVQMGYSSDSVWYWENKG